MNQSEQLEGYGKNKRKEILDPSSNAEEPPVSEHRLHKRRQRKRNQDSKQNALTELMNRINSMDGGLSPSKVEDLYSSIPSDPQNAKDYFWSKVPCMCDPCKAVMGKTIADDSKLDRDKKYQTKYKKKLAVMQGMGKITQAENQEMWTKHGRAADDTAGVSLLSARRGQRKA